MNIKVAAFTVREKSSNIEHFSWPIVSYLPYVQVDKHDITFYTTYISVDLAHHEIVRAKVARCGLEYLSNAAYEIAVSQAFKFYYI